ncbi:MAG: cytochrome-c peroxidase [Saprospiraceae bacterium]
MRTRLPLLLLAVFLISFSSCVKKEADIEYNYYKGDGLAELKQTLDLREPPLEYKNDFPSYYTGFSSPFDEDLATLGRVVFYDKSLSSDGTISCASCHDQAAAFADPVAFSEGVDGKVTARNSLALGSVFSFQEYYGSMSFNRVPFFWDNRANSVEDQSKETFANEREMNMQMHQVVNVVNDRSYYKPLIDAATNGRTTNADENLVLQAVGVFVNSISSYNSKYDDALADYFDEHRNLDDIESVDLPKLSPLENEGKDVYMENCSSCHGTTNGFPGEFAANNGLDLEYEDDGAGNGEFKVPTLRNITLTYPYMHDGRFATIDEVLKHYETGIKPHQNLSPALKTNSGQPKRIDLDNGKKEALKAFLETFTDEEVLTAEKYSDPFFQ